jgi:hypothetical protein
VRIFLDIETIPTTNPAEIAAIAEGVIAHNATLKKPHDADTVKQLIDEAHRKTSLDGAAGEVVVIAVALEGGPVRSWQREMYGAADEAMLLTRFRNDLHEMTDGRGAVVVGHNAVGFDRPFLRQRGLVTGVALPGYLTAPVKPWEATEIDTMLMWTGGASGQKIGLDRLARALGLPGKTGDIDGKNVWDAIIAHRIDDVAAYCRADVELTRQVFNRMRAVGAEAHQ